MPRPQKTEPSEALDVRRRTLGIDPRHLNLSLVLDPRHTAAHYDDPVNGRERTVEGSPQDVLHALWRAGYRVTLRTPPDTP